MNYPNDAIHTAGPFLATLQKSSLTGNPLELLPPPPPNATSVRIYICRISKNDVEKSIRNMLNTFLGNATNLNNLGLQDCNPSTSAFNQESAFLLLLLKRDTENHSCPLGNMTGKEDTQNKIDYNIGSGV